MSGGTRNRPALSSTDAILVGPAREYLTASAQGGDALAAHLGCKRDEVYAYACGAAEVHIRNLLDVIGELTGGGR